MMRFFLLTSAFLLLLFVFVSSSAYAKAAVVSSYHVTYTLEQNNKTHVQFDVILTNTSSEYYSPTHTIIVGFPDIKNPASKDSQGTITPLVEKQERGYAITTTLHKPAAGKNKQAKYTLSFESASVAQQGGNITELTIPGITKKNDFLDYIVSVRVPRTLGKPTYSKPQADTQTQNSTYTIFTYTKSQLESSGISLVYGTQQVYDFTLTYHVRNTNLFPQTSLIALPPSTNYQTVYINTMSKKPENVVEDPDGNWLASYLLKPGEKKDIVVKGSVVVFLHPKKQPLSKDTYQQYLRETNYWQVNDKKIRELAKNLKTTQAIYQYVVQTLSYNYPRAVNNTTRFGGVDALQQPMLAICLEFTDLFITLARAAGIPAREVNGYAYTNGVTARPLSLSKDILHAWPEYYDEQKQTWIMVDPTWQKTTNGVDYFQIFDFDHITFVRKGLSSIYPLPAGTYKYSQSHQAKDVVVRPTTRMPRETIRFSLEPQVSSHAVSFLPVQTTLIVENQGNTKQPPPHAIVTTQTLSPSQQKIVFSPLPPFGKRKTTVSFHSQDILTKYDDTVTIRFNEKSVRKTITISPLPLQQYLTGGELLVIVSGIIISILAFLTWRLSFSGRRR